jgi:hypothetical protein
MVLSSPLFNAQSRHAAKLPGVAGDQPMPVCQRGGGDQKIIPPDHLSTLLQVRLDFGVDRCRVALKGYQGPELK